ncbi:MAG: hypothetical protein NTX50_14100 [Candidatus Sumerlaeota bacterium]|nr:hypothetical protein [Candidatus Sumerlaeota bacterium]
MSTAFNAPAPSGKAPRLANIRYLLIAPNLTPMRIWLILLSLLWLPCCAYANAGTGELFIGALPAFVALNVLIGVFEAFVIAQVFKLPMRQSCETMVKANLFSGVAGGLILVLIPMDAFFSDGPLRNTALGLLIGFLLISFLLSFLIEWPFCSGLFSENSCQRELGFRASFVAQTSSHSIWLLLILLPSFSSSLGSFQIDSSPARLAPDIGTVFYLEGPYSKVLKSKSLATSESVQLTDRRYYWGDLYFRRNDSGSLDLWMRENDATSRCLVSSVADGIVSSRDMEAQITGSLYEYYTKVIADLRLPSDRIWRAIHVGPYPRFTNDETSLSLFLGRSDVRYVTMLPGNLVLMQLDRQIGLADLNTKKIAFFARGVCPVVVLKKNWMKYIHASR